MVSVEMRKLVRKMGRKSSGGKKKGDEREMDADTRENCRFEDSGRRDGMVPAIFWLGNPKEDEREGGYLV